MIPEVASLSESQLDDLIKSAETQKRKIQEEKKKINKKSFTDLLKKESNSNKELAELIKLYGKIKNRPSKKFKISLEIELNAEPDTTEILDSISLEIELNAEPDTTEILDSMNADCSLHEFHSFDFNPGKVFCKDIKGNENEKSLLEEINYKVEEFLADVCTDIFYYSKDGSKYFGELCDDFDKYQSSLKKIKDYYNEKFNINCDRDYLDIDDLIISHLENASKKNPRKSKQQ